MIPSVDILTSPISLGSFDECVRRILSLGKLHQSSFTCCANVHMVVEAYKDPSFESVLAAADQVTADGMPIAKGIKMMYGIDQERVAGMDMFPELLEKAEEEGLSVYLYGDTDETLSRVEEKALSEHPALKIAGTCSPPFRQLTEEEELEIVNGIRQSGAHIVFVALGCPKQERWMASHKGIVEASMVGIGNAFRTYLGVEQRAPEWMQKNSLEWLYRFIQNPRRLWKRYVSTNSLFLLLMLKNWLFAKRQAEPIL